MNFYVQLSRSYNDPVVTREVARNLLGTPAFSSLYPDHLLRDVSSSHVLRTCIRTWHEMMEGCLISPILEPDLYLSRNQRRYFPGEFFSPGSIWVRLTSEFVHEVPRLAVSEPSGGSAFSC